MKLYRKYIQVINNSSLHITGIPLLVPPAIVVYLFHPETLYSFKLLVVGALSVIIQLLHIAIGVKALITREYNSVVNFLVMPICMVIIMSFFLFK